MDGHGNFSKSNLFPRNFLNNAYKSSANGESNVIKQYVSEVLDFSSQYGSDSSVSYTAYNLTGKPSNYPDYGDFPQAFAMKTYGRWWKDLPSFPRDYMPQNNPDIIGQDYIDVSFDLCVYPSAVEIVEIHNPGAVVRIWALDASGHTMRWSLLWEGEPQCAEHKPRKFTPPIKNVDFKTRVLRIEFNHSALDYYTGLDAVQLTGTPSPIPRQCQKIAHEVISRNLHNIPFNTQPVDLNKLLSDFVKKAQMDSCDIDGQDVPQTSLDSLPNETLLKILGYLDLSSLRQVACVSRNLYELATDTLLYSRISLKPYWHMLSDDILLSLAARCSRLQRLDLSWCGSYGLITASAFERFVTECCENLTHIRLNCCSFVRNSSIKALAHTCPKLKELALRNCAEINEIGFLHLTSLTQLQTLDLYRTMITGGCLVSILKANPNLQHLNIGACAKVNNMDEVALTLGSCNPELLSLDLWKTINLSQTGVRALSQCSKLLELDLGWCLSQSIPVESLTSLAHGCRHLRKLFLTALRGITDKDLEPIMSACPDLEQLDLMGVHSVTADGCFRLLLSLEKLRLLDLSFCYQISAATVENWRPLFPNVALKSSRSVVRSS